jgi:hypothetical protein
MSEAQRLLVMADYFADPIWLRTAHGGGSVSINLESLPLRDDLIAKLRAWAARFDALQHSDYEWPDDATRVSWTEEGHRLTDLVRDELGPDFDVQYFHEQP